MGLKLWYQSLGRTESWTGYRAHLQTMVDGARDPQTVIEIHGTTKGVAEQYRYLEHLLIDEVVANLHRALEQNFDAFLIGNFYDPALHICREISSIPVLGIAETSCHLACMMGSRFAIVAPNDKGALRIRDYVGTLGLERRMQGVAAVGEDRILSLGKVFESEEARTDFVQVFEAAAAPLVAAGAEVVIPGGGILAAALDLSGRRSTAGGATILNGIAGLVTMGEIAARLNKLSGGAFVSKRLSYRAPPAQMMDEIRRFYGEDVYPVGNPDETRNE